VDFPTPAFLLFAALTAVASPVPAAAAEKTPPGSPEVARAQYLWSKSPHGRMLERILPPSIEPAQLPEPDSEGARLTVRYCVQCHYLPSPQMHTADKWGTIVVRMVWRMQGKGNMGVLMKEMMDSVEAPAESEAARPHVRSRQDVQHRLHAVPRAAGPAAAHRPRMARGGAAHEAAHHLGEHGGWPRLPPDHAGARYRRDRAFPAAQRARKRRVGGEVMK
jgi:hypothetical protein